MQTTASNKPSGLTTVSHSNSFIEYEADTISRNTISSGVYPDTYSVYATNEVVTNHAYDLWVDHLILNRDGKGINNRNKGDRVWIFDADAGGIDVIPNLTYADTYGRFIDLYTNKDVRTYMAKTLYKLVDESYAASYVAGSVKEDTLSLIHISEPTRPY